MIQFSNKNLIILYLLLQTNIRFTSSKNRAAVDEILTGLYNDVWQAEFTPP